MCNLLFITIWISILLIVVVLADGAPLEQYTPEQADWSTFQSKAVTESSNTAHDPDGVSWISAAAWEEARWDGTTIYNPSKMTKSEFVSAICPSVDRIRGIREVFYQHKPFANNSDPTKAEVDEWHRIALNHVRALIGYSSEDRQVKKDTCMFARSLWGQQRRFTTQWDTDYPGTTGSAYGPCQGGNNAHCGATFVPNTTAQRPFLDPLNFTGACSTAAGSEGVFSGPKSNIPWSLKWSRGLCNTLIAEGFWGGHVGPFFHREKFGFSFWDDDPSNNNNNAVLRAKWTGKLMTNLYCNPVDSDCDPEQTGPAQSTNGSTSTDSGSTSDSNRGSGGGGGGGSESSPVSSPVPSVFPTTQAGATAGPSSPSTAQPSVSTNGETGGAGPASSSSLEFNAAPTGDIRCVQFCEAGVSQTSQTNFVVFVSLIFAVLSLIG